MDNNFVNFFENEEVRIKTSIEAYIKKNLNCSIEQTVKSETYNKLKMTFIKQINALGNSKELNEYIFNKIDKEMDKYEKNGSVFKDVLPKGFDNNLKVYAYNNSPRIISEIKKLIKKKSTEKRIKSEINKFISSLNPMIAKFINADNIYLKIVEGIDDYFNNPESSMEVVMTISNLIEKGMEKEIKGVTMYFPYEGRKAIIESLRDGIIKIAFCNESINRILFQLENVLKQNGSIYDLLLKLDPDVDKIIKIEVDEMFNYIKTN